MKSGPKDELAVDDFRLPDDTGSIGCRYSAGCDWAVVGSDELEKVKWASGHLEFCGLKGIEWPVRLSAYALPQPVLETAFYAISILPSREQDCCQVLDVMYCQHDIGCGKTIDGKCIFIDSSQALPRQAVGFDFVPCILPGSKVVDLAQCRILSGSHVLRLQGVLDTIDCKVRYGCTSERVQSDLAGNACAGWSFGSALISSFGSVKVHTAPMRRTPGKSVPPERLALTVCDNGRRDKRIACAEERPIKRHQHDDNSGLGILLNIGLQG